MSMNVVYAILVLGGLGGALALILAGMSQVFSFERDARLDFILEALPGADCGNCGYAGCSALADALIAGEAAVDICPMGGDAVAEKLAAILDVDIHNNVRLTALVRCSGGTRAQKKFEYSGLQDCVAATKLGAGGPMECSYGCIGLGTCAGACPTGAISVNDGVAVVDHERCTGCLACIRVCPKNIIIPIPYYADVAVPCSSHDKGSVLRQVCGIGCLGCRVCEKVCQQGAISITDSLASIDYQKCTGCGDCAEKCPRKLILDANLDRGPRMVDETE